MRGPTTLTLNLLLAACVPALALTAQEVLDKVKNTYTEMYNTILEKYGATPERYRRDPSMIQQLGNYYAFLKRIKKAVDPNNILNPGVNLFEEENEE